MERIEQMVNLTTKTTEAPEAEPQIPDMHIKGYR